MTTFNTSPHSSKDEITIQLQIPHQHAGDIVSWLVEQSITFGVHFLQPRHSELPIVKDGAEVYLPFADKISKSDSEINAVQKTGERRISDVLDSHITNGLTQHLPTQEEIATELNISVSALKSQFKALYGKTFYQVFMDKKMEYAAQLLKQGFRANKVSAMVGYGEKSSIKFNKMFQKHFGMTPKKYQIQNQK